MGQIAQKVVVVNRGTTLTETGATKPLLGKKNLKATLTDVQKALLYKTLEDQSYIQAGVQFGLDKFYKSDKYLATIIKKIRDQVENNPEKYCVLPETVEKVKAAVQYRIDHVGEAMTRNRREYQQKLIIAKGLPADTVFAKKLSPRERRNQLEAMSITELATSLRQKSGGLLFHKMERIGESAKRLDEVSIASLATVYSTTFDKAQIVTGQATENIAILAKIDDGLTPKQSLEAILGMREKNLTDKDRKK